MTRDEFADALNALPRGDQRPPAGRLRPILWPRRKPGRRSRFREYAEKALAGPPKTKCKALALRGLCNLDAMPEEVARLHQGAMRGLRLIAEKVASINKPLAEVEIEADDEILAGMRWLGECRDVGYRWQDGGTTFRIAAAEPPAFLLLRLRVLLDELITLAEQGKNRLCCCKACGKFSWGGNVARKTCDDNCRQALSRK